MDTEDIRRALVGQQRHCDQKIAEMRRWYEGFSAEERGQFRSWLEKQNALERECPFSLTVNLLLETEEFDDEDETTDYNNCQFAADTVLMAVKKWDAGETVIPKGVLP